MEPLKMYPPPSQNAIAADSSNFFAQSSNQQSQGPAGMSNPDQLRLTAQLSRNVPNVNAGQGGILQEAQDPRGNMNQYHPDQSQGQGMDMHGSPSQMGQMAEQYGSPDGSSRKRSKVSRACDECRRKKIRCDATEESGDQQCTNCKRVGGTCQFSRVPLKRGPSKGYIKHLADRLITVENALQTGELSMSVQPYPQENALQRGGPDEFSPPPNMDTISRKRTYSSASGDIGGPYSSQRPSGPGWPPQEVQRQLPHHSAAYGTPSAGPSTGTQFREPNYSPNAFQPAAKWRNAPEPPLRQSISFENLPGDQSYLEHAAEWDESIVDGYYAFIHPTYPILSHNKDSLISRLASITPHLREAFHESLGAAVRSFPTLGAPAPESQISQRAIQIITASLYENQAGRTIAVNIISLQMLLLLAIEADNRDPTITARVSQSQWLGNAVGLAYLMKLHTGNTSSHQLQGDPDSDDKLARRLWLSLVIMDRWHAASTSSPLFIPDSAVVFSQDDQALLGDSNYQLARISNVLGHFTLIPTDLTTPAPVLTTIARGELGLVRESLSPSIFPLSQYPLMYLCYWYLQIILALRLPETEPQDLLEPAQNIVTDLQNNAGLVSPLTHHATALAAGTLISLTKCEQTKLDAESTLRILLEGHIAPSGWDASINILIANSLSPKLLSGAGGALGAKIGASQSQDTAIQGLQHLADLATATEEESLAGEGRKESSDGQIFQRFHDLRDLVRTGYLSKLGGGGLGDTAR